MPIAARVSQLHLSGIRTVMALAAERQKRELPVIHMEVGQPDFPTPAHITEAGFAAARNGFTGYTPNAGVQSLRDSVAAKVSASSGIRVSGANVCITSGAVMALYLTLMAVIEPGDEVLVPDPGWPNYISAVEMVGGTVVPYKLDPSDGYWMDLDALSSKVSPRCRAIMINYPSNPTGATVSVEKMSKLVKFAEDHDLQVISDEVYEDFVFEGTHVSALSHASQERVIMISGASKSYSMTGWRLGWVVAREEVIQAVSKLVEPIASCPSSVAQAAVEAAINGPQDCVAEMKAAYKRRAEIAVSILEPAGLLISKPMGAFYAMVDISKSNLNSDQFVRRLLEEKGVATAPGETFGHSTRSSIRISTAASDDDVREGCKRIRDFISLDNLTDTAQHTMSDDQL
ncbi:pyridoxal phosphate-dependent aminotransferase [Pseudohalocynthiibacter aestuariivivens]|uniref:Aminotransferase n=1 Tax=Pseudohalocynthiibacter aestuariivivens TaxID=1591409 RepID=A0ABV5JE42_9RHOB|nr:pyridoxal phosphate-dependent aminotransferase [Pseudohalocynthiibacter aestuariivivens]MBS9718779.1 pyridoxal phosphate-dependent aminotransferase [Pseudohalocynthiibacter aestuariivivens]